MELTADSVSGEFMASWSAVAHAERWTRMRTLLTTLALSFMMLGCATAPKHVHAVWTQPTPPPADLPVPPGFTITPTQAVAAARDSRLISLKHISHIYADSRYYYVHDTFLGDSPRRAYVQGVRVDGQTGEIVRR
jgi:hypothetical protein